MSPSASHMCQREGTTGKEKCHTYCWWAAEMPDLFEAWDY